MKIIILQGLPASGKTTFALDYCKKNKNFVRVNRDDLRNMRGEYWVPKQEDMISGWEYDCVAGALRDDKSVILDSTNLNPGYLRKWEELADVYGAKLEYKKFDLDVEECIKRDLKRENSVGADVIQGMHDKYFAKKVDPVAVDPMLPTAMIVDIDGTLAHSVDRGPYDWGKVGNDTLDHCVLNMVDGMRKYLDCEVIIMTGRDGVCAEETRDWLVKHGVPFDYLYTRPEGNFEKDTIIKERMYREHVEGKYNVVFVLDDRDCCIKLWRSLGLKALQVEEGAF